MRGEGKGKMESEKKSSRAIPIAIEITMRTSPVPRVIKCSPKYCPIDPLGAHPSYHLSTIYGIEWAIYDVQKIRMKLSFRFVCPFCLNLPHSISSAHPRTRHDQ